MITNRMMNEEWAGYNLEESFFSFSGIDPDAEFENKEDPTYMKLLEHENNS